MCVNCGEQSCSSCSSNPVGSYLSSQIIYDGPEITLGDKVFPPGSKLNDVLSSITQATGSEIVNYQSGVLTDNDPGVDAYIVMDNDVSLSPGLYEVYFSMGTDLVEGTIFMALLDIAQGVQSSDLIEDTEGNSIQIVIGNSDSGDLSSPDSGAAVALFRLTEETEVNYIIYTDTNTNNNVYWYSLIKKVGS